MKGGDLDLLEKTDEVKRASESFHGSNDGAESRFSSLKHVNLRFPTMSTQRLLGTSKARMNRLAEYLLIVRTMPELADALLEFAFASAELARALEKRWDAASIKKVQDRVAEGKARLEARAEKGEQNEAELRERLGAPLVAAGNVDGMLAEWARDDKQQVALLRDHIRLTALVMKWPVPRGYLRSSDKGPLDELRGILAGI